MPSTESLTFRTATVTDAEMLATLAASSFRQAYEEQWEAAGLTAYIRNAFTPRQLRQELQDANATFLLVYCEQEAVGYAKLLRNQNPPELQEKRAIRIQRIYLLKKVIGYGTGRHLMEKCLSLARAEGYDTVWLAVWPANKRAIAFYQRMGFVVDGTYPFHAGEIQEMDWLMKLDIAPDNGPGDT